MAQNRPRLYPTHCEAVRPPGPGRRSRRQEEARAPPPQLAPPGRRGSSGNSARGPTMHDAAQASGPYLPGCAARRVTRDTQRYTTTAQFVVCAAWNRSIARNTPRCKPSEQIGSDSAQHSIAKLHIPHSSLGVVIARARPPQRLCLQTRAIGAYSTNPTSSSESALGGTAWAGPGCEARARGHDPRPLRRAGRRQARQRSGRFARWLSALLLAITRHEYDEAA